MWEVVCAYKQIAVHSVIRIYVAIVCGNAKIILTPLSSYIAHVISLDLVNYFRCIHVIIITYIFYTLSVPICLLLYVLCGVYHNLN